MPANDVAAQQAKREARLARRKAGGAQSTNAAVATGFSDGASREAELHAARRAQGLQQGRGSGGHMLALYDLPHPAEAADVQDGDDLTVEDEVRLEACDRAVGQLKSAWWVAARACAAVKAFKLARRIDGGNRGWALSRGLSESQFYLLVNSYETVLALAPDQEPAGWPEPFAQTSAYALEGFGGGADGEVSDRSETSGELLGRLGSTSAAHLAPIAQAKGAAAVAEVYEAVAEVTGKEQPSARDVQATVRNMRAAGFGSSTPPEQVAEMAREAAPKGRPRRVAAPVVTSVPEADTADPVALLQGAVRQLRTEQTANGEAHTTLPGTGALDQALRDAVASGRAGDAEPAIKALTRYAGQLAEHYIDRAAVLKGLAAIQ